MAVPGRTSVFFDGDCPLCRREIAFYRRRTGADEIHWIDVGAAGDGEVFAGLSREQALARFHVVNMEGQLMSGGAAFVYLWQCMPGFRPLGLLFRGAVSQWFLERVYFVFVRFRPLLQAFVGRIDDR